MKPKMKTIQLLGLSLFLTLTLAGCSNSKTDSSANQEMVDVQVATSVLPNNQMYCDGGTS